MLLSRITIRPVGSGRVRPRRQNPSRAARRAGTLAALLLSLITTGCANTPVRTVANYLLAGTAGDGKSKQSVFPVIGYPMAVAASGIAELVSGFGNPELKYDYEAWARARRELAAKERGQRSTQEPPSPMNP